MTDLSLPDLEELRAVAEAAATSAGRVILEYLDDRRTLHMKSSPSDPVSELDKRSEAQVLRLLDRRRPADGVLSEESPERPTASGVRWVVDALDGTVNHLYGLPHCAVSIAAEIDDGHGWRAVAGVVHDPIRAETFSASRGGGAALDGRPLRVNEPVTLSQALVATEFSYAVESRRRQVEVLRRVLLCARDIRCTGSSALDLCWTAAGRFDAFYEDELQRWDWAAGRMILEEAGGRTAPLGTGVRGAGPTLHHKLEAILGVA
jgi:myo-inositol-1(or 4)-monophosphatase